MDSMLIQPAAIGQGGTEGWSTDDLKFVGNMVAEGLDARLQYLIDGQVQLGNGALGAGSFIFDLIPGQSEADNLLEASIVLYEDGRWGSGRPHWRDDVVLEPSTIPADVLPELAKGFRAVQLIIDGDKQRLGVFLPENAPVAQGLRERALGLVSMRKPVSRSSILLGAQIEPARTGIIENPISSDNNLRDTYVTGMLTVVAQGVDDQKAQGVIDVLQHNAQAGGLTPPKVIDYRKAEDSFQIVPNDQTADRIFVLNQEQVSPTLLEVLQKIGAVVMRKGQFDSLYPEAVLVQNRNLIDIEKDGILIVPVKAKPGSRARNKAKK